MNSRSASGSVIRRMRLDWFAAAVVFPTWGFYNLHYGYFPVYGSEKLHPAGYDYASGIFRFRILGVHLVSWVYDHFGTMLGRHIGHRPFWMFRAIPTLDSGLYAAHFIVNLVGYLVASSLLYFLLCREGKRGSGFSLYLLVQIIMLVSGFAITPYDFLAYAFLLAAVACLHWQSRAAVFVAVAVTILGALTRETQALAICYGIVLVLVSDRKTARRAGLITIAMAVAYAATYVSLRSVLGWSSGVVQAVTLDGQGLIGDIGLLADVVALVLVQWLACGGNTRVEARITGLLLVVTLPYTFGLVMGGFWNEFRLVVPLVLVQAVALFRLRGIANESVLTSAEGWLRRRRDG